MMNIRVFLSSFFILAMASCAMNPGSPNASSQTDAPASQISMPPISPKIISTTTPTIEPITLSAACLQDVETSDWSAKVPVTCLPSPSRQAIIQVLFSVWLDHFISANVPDEFRLEKAAIVSIDQVEDSPNAGFTTVITYSVKPTIPLTSNPASWWAAGDGFPGEAGWVRNKKDNVWVVKSGDFYEIRISPYGAA